MKITFEDYDKVLERFEKLKTETLWPTKEQIEAIFEAEPDKWILFACFLHDYGTKPKDEDEANRKKLLMEFINRHLEFTE